MVLWPPPPPSNQTVSLDGTPVLWLRKRLVPPTAVTLGSLAGDSTCTGAAGSYLPSVLLGFEPPSPDDTKIVTPSPAIAEKYCESVCIWPGYELQLFNIVERLRYAVVGPESRQVGVIRKRVNHDGNFLAGSISDRCVIRFSDFGHQIRGVIANQFPCSGRFSNGVNERMQV